MATRRGTGGVARAKPAKKTAKKAAAKKRANPLDALCLPTEKSTPAGRLADYIVLLYGREKVGKTTLVAQFPDVFFLSTEPGTRALSVFGRYARTWKEVVRYIDLLEDTPGKFANVCLDTVDNAYDMCMEFVCDKLGIDHPSDEDYGKGWKAVSQEFYRQLRRIHGSGRGVILLSHAKEIEIKARTRGNSGSSRHVTQPTMSGSARRVIEPMADVWGYYEYADGGKRELHIIGNDNFLAGNRLGDEPAPRFINPATGEQWAAIDMGRSAPEAYRNFMAAFENKFTGKTVKKTAKKTAKKTGRRTVRRKS